MIYRKSSLIAAIGFTSAFAFAQQPAPSAPTDPPKEKAADEVPLKVTLTGEPLQKVKDGLLFTIEVANTSAAPVSLYDPSDVMDISLVGNEGFPAALPPVTPMISIAGGDRRKMREQLDQKRAFTVVAASMAVPAGAKTLADLNAAGEVVLEPGAKLIMTVRISQILANPAKFIADQKLHAAQPEPKGPPPPEPETQAIPADRYMVRVLIPFISNGKSMGRFLISNELKVDLK